LSPSVHLSMPPFHSVFFSSSPPPPPPPSFFFFNAPPTTEISPLSLHDALPIWPDQLHDAVELLAADVAMHHLASAIHHRHLDLRSEEHTSELQSLTNLVCRLLLEKKKKK